MGKQVFGFDLWFWLIALSLLIVGAVAMSGGAAQAHDAIPTAAKPNGWTYPSGCCSGIDCREVADSAISEPNSEHQTYIIKATGEAIAQSDTRIRPSPDGVFHWCSVQGKPDTRTICLFVPPRGF